MLSGMPRRLHAIAKRLRFARRFAGAFLAVFVGLQSGAAVAVSDSAGASCCCKHPDRSVDCPCPACTHGRELEAGKPVLKTCNTGGGLEAVAFLPVAMLAPPEHALPQAARRPSSPPFSKPPHEPPDFDLDTPPPLA
jgi:hypothetical protein